MAANKGKISIIGSGLVGKSWAMIFASAGYQVSLFDQSPELVDQSVKEISKSIDKFEKDGILRGQLSAFDQKKLISASQSLSGCLEDSIYVQESIPESLELKRRIWKEIDKLVKNLDVILASSTSCIVPSKISEGLEHKDQFIVAHPVNPPYYAPMVELVPAPWTNERTRTKAREIMTEIGQVPVSLSKELPGFVLNRIQYSILNECWRLVAGGVVSAEDVDVVMKDGLGLRYAFMGPMETIHLNAEGTQNYCDRYGETIFRVSQDFGPIPDAWKQRTVEEKAEVARVSAEMDMKYPTETLQARRERRDKCLAALAKLKKDLPK